MPISFAVREVLLPDAALNVVAPALKTRPVPEPWTKNYDAEPGNSPLDWPARFDVREWVFLAAYAGEDRVGGAVLIARESGIEMLEGRNDIAVIWDLRVAPAHRGRGVARALLNAAAEWARAQRIEILKVETQNINVPACRLYARHGFVLRAVNAEAYPGLPGETQLLWYKRVDLASDDAERNIPERAPPPPSRDSQ